MKRILVEVGSILVGLVLLWPGTAAAEPTSAKQPSRAATAEPPPPPKPAAFEGFVNLGFSHWFGQTFGAPPGMTTPALVVGVRPGISLLEIRAHYTVSLDKHELPTNGERSHVGFANLDLLMTRELRASNERMILQFGPAAGFVHTKQGLGFAYGAVLAARYMIDMGKGFALGPFFDARWQLYDLPGSDVPLYEVDDGKLEAGHSDAQSHVGVALSLW